MTKMKDNTLLPAYLVVGGDELKRNTALQRLKARLASSGDISFNFDEFNGEYASGEDIVSSCNTLPFASDFRLVKVVNAEKLKKQDSDAIVEYLSAPLSSTVLALSAEKLAKNTRLYKACAAIGEKAVIDCSPKKRYELPRMVKTMARGYGISLTDAGALALLDLVGENTVLLDAELKKLSLCCAGMTCVSDKDVNSLVARTSEVKPWEFVDSFSSRDLALCLTLWNNMQSRNVYSLIAQCTERIRELIAAQSLDKRGEISQLARTLGVNDWRVKNHRNWSRKFSSSELRRALQSAANTEYLMKSGADPESVFFDWFVEVLK